MRHMTVIGPNGEPNRVVEYDAATLEGTIYYVFTHGSKAGTVDLTDTTTVYGCADMGSRITVWLQDGCTIVPGALGLED